MNESYDCDEKTTIAYEDLYAKRTAANSNGPLNDVIPHGAEGIDPIARYSKAGINRIQIEQAYGKTGSKRDKRDAC